MRTCASRARKEIVNSTPLPVQSPRGIRALVAATLSVLLIIAGAVTTPPAIAATTPTTGGTLSWGIDAQYLSFFEGRAHDAPANWSDGDTVANFPANPAGSSYDPVTKSGTLSYSGNVRVGYFAGPPLPGVADGNYVYLKNPKIVVNGVTGSLIAGQIAGSSHSLVSELPTHSGNDVTIATLDLSVDPLSSATSVSWASVPVSITAEGATYLAKYASADDSTPTVRAEGSALAPLSFALTMEAPARAAPAVQLSATADLDPAGESITITGSGFFPNAPETNGKRPPLSGKFGGAYVQFGYYDGSTWKGGSSADANLTKWALGPDEVNIAGALGVTITDGGFTATLTPVPVESAPAEARYGIRTFAGSGSTYAPFSTFTEIAFAQETPAPEITVFRADGVTPVGDTAVNAGDTLVVKGSGFDPTANVGGSGIPIPSTLPQGTFVVFGNFADNWRPSEAHASSTRVMHKDARIWALAEGVLNQVPAPFQSNIREAWAPIDDDGSFVAEVSAISPEQPLADGNWGIYTYPAGVGTAPNPRQELAVAITFVTDDEGAEPSEPTEPTTPPTAMPGGSLRWGISSSFAHYITGPIASGSIAVSGGATRGAGLFQFGQASGSTFNAQTGLGTVRYSGSVRFTGHGGVLDVTVSNPQVRITSASTATLYVSSGGSLVAFATLNLASATKTVTNGAVTYRGIPASLTSAGQSQVLQGNATTLDPVTLTIGNPAAAPAGVTGTVASAKPSSGVDQIPATPPATTGMKLTTGECVTEGATLRWGFKESFLSYVEGIAQGGWDVTDIEYSYPEFVWSGGNGKADADAANGMISYGGGIVFHGHDGALDTALNTARIEFAGDVGYIVFDIVGTTQDGETVDAREVRLVEFSLAGVAAVDGAIVLDAIPSTLTNAGAQAFGTYPAGEEFAPVSATIPVDPDCGVVAEVETSADEVEVEDATAPVWPWILGGGFIVLVLAAASGVLVSRRRKEAAATISSSVSGH